MKLQANLKGSWRDVAEFPAPEMPMVRFAAGMLARSMSGGKLAIVSDAGTRYYHAMEGGHPVWRDSRGDELLERVP